MRVSADLVLGEFNRTLDDRFRLSLPPELTQPLFGAATEAVLAKERPGCLSLWDSAIAQQNLSAGVHLVTAKMQAGKLEGRWNEVQRLGRLLSTRHATVQLANRGRLLIPESFRGFLGVEPNQPLTIVGAGVCLEIWQPTAWLRYLETEIADFRSIFDKLTS